VGQAGDYQIATRANVVGLATTSCCSPSRHSQQGEHAVARREKLNRWWKLRRAEAPKEEIADGGGGCGGGNC
jgi:hypothetical protein